MNYLFTHMPQPSENKFNTTFSERLESELITLEPLQEHHFEELYLIASDYKIWEQHPNPDRYKKEVFRTFFEGALKSQSAFLIIENLSQMIIGSTRFYDYNNSDKSIAIGYTFLAQKYWGGKYNPEVKKIMINYAFKFIDKIYFHIGSLNKRSQIAIERLGAKKILEKEITYYGENPKLNFVYEINKEDWKN